MSHIFICYSREDLDYAQRIVDALTASNLDTWVDWKNIPSGENWVQEIHQGIESANAFLFLLSPYSAESQMCNIEIAHAIRNGKRILPIFIPDVEDSEIYKITEKFHEDEIKDEINRRNFIFCREDKEDFNTAIEEIQTTIHTDFEWLIDHTRLQVKAVEWKRNKFERSFLLQGKELRIAEKQLDKYSSTEPYPTDLQKDYVQKSRQDSKRRKRLVSIISLLTTILLAGVAFFGLRQKILAREHELSTQAGELATRSEALRDTNFPLALLLGVEAYSIHVDDQTLSELRENAQTNPQLIKFWFGNAQSSYDKIHLVSFSPDGNTLAVQWRDEILLRDVETGNLMGQPLGKYLISIGGKAFSPNGKIMALADGDNNIVIWDVESGQPIGQPLRGHTDFITLLVFSPDGKRLASAGMDGTIILWDLETGKPIAESPSQTNFLVFSPDGGILASPGMDKKIILWDVRTGKQIGESTNEITTRRNAPVFSHDGETLLYIDAEGKIILWNIGTGLTKSLSFEEYNGSGTLDISPSGERAVLHPYLYPLTIWDVETGNQVGQPLDVNTDQYIVFSPDGKLLALRRQDKSITLLNLETGQSFGQLLRGYVDSIVGLIFSPDGTLLVAGGDDVITFWNLHADVNTLQNLKPKTLIQKTCERVGRNFTQAEWQQYFPGEEYRLTCPQWPAGE